jgi:hypothetical protein
MSTRLLPPDSELLSAAYLRRYQEMPAWKRDVVDALMRLPPATRKRLLILEGLRRGLDPRTGKPFPPGVDARAESLKLLRSR